MNKNDFTNSGILNIRNAIVQKAAEDYIKNKVWCLKNEGPKTINSTQADEVRKIAKWFRSEAFAKLALTVDGEYMIAELDKLAKDKVRGKK